MPDKIKFHCKQCKTEHSISLDDLIKEGFIKENQETPFKIRYVCNSGPGRILFNTKKAYDNRAPSWAGPSTIEILLYYLWNTNERFYKII